MTETKPALPHIDDLIRAGALFVANHSGGKDSQAQAEHAGLPFVVAHAVKTFFDMVEHRFKVRPGPNSSCWPSASNRQCTSDLKRGPIEREVRRYAKANGFSWAALAISRTVPSTAASCSRSTSRSSSALATPCTNPASHFESLSRVASPAPGTKGVLRMTRQSNQNHNRQTETVGIANDGPGMLKIHRWKRDGLAGASGFSPLAGYSSICGAKFTKNVTTTRIGDCCRRCFPNGIPNEGGSP